jgi:hypothetical protein
MRPGYEPRAGGSCWSRKPFPPLFLGLLTLVPDTPRWFVMKGRSDKALEVLNRLVGESEARTTSQEIKTSLVVPAQAGNPCLPSAAW